MGGKEELRVILVFDEKTNISPHIWSAINRSVHLKSSNISFIVYTPINPPHFFEKIRDLLFANIIHTVTVQWKPFIKENLEKDVEKCLGSKCIIFLDRKYEQIVYASKIGDTIVHFL